MKEIKPRDETSNHLAGQCRAAQVRNQMKVKQRRCNAARCRDACIVFTAGEGDKTIPPVGRQKGWKHGEPKTEQVSGEFNFYSLFDDTSI